MNANRLNLTITASGEREVVMTRAFDAPRQFVFDALTKPELLRRWMLGPEGWSMPVCEIDLRPGGSYRYIWRKEAEGTEMGVSGIYRDVLPIERLVHTERFDEAWYPGESVITTVLTEEEGGTHFQATIVYESKEARDAVLSSGFESGVAISYERLAALFIQDPN